MKISTFLATGLGVFLLAGAANATTVNYVAHLTGAQSQNTNYTSTATADATLSYDDVAKTLTGVVQYPGTVGTKNGGFTIVPSGGHLRSGACGETGTIVSALTLEAASTAEGGALSLNNTTPLDTDQITALTAGNLFLTIENTTYPSPESEIRGQVVLASDTTNDYCAAALAAAEVDAGTGTDSGKDSGTTVTPDGGTTGTAIEPNGTTTTSSSGCNTTGSTSPGSAAALALGLGLALYGISRKRKQA